MTRSGVDALDRLGDEFQRISSEHASRRHRLPRLRFMWRLPAAVAAIAALFIAAQVTYLWSPLNDEQSARPGSTATTLLDSPDALSIFRRARTADDAVPHRSEDAPTSDAPGAPILLFSNSRRLIHTEQETIYAVPATRRGTSLICLVHAGASAPTGMECAPTTAATAEATPLGSATLQSAVFLIADGVDRVQFTLRDGTNVQEPVTDNAAGGSFRSPPERMSWTGPSGKSYSLALR